MIGFADKLVHNCEREIDRQFLYVDRRLLTIAVLFYKCDVRISSLDDAVPANGKALCDELPDHSPGGVVISNLAATGDYDGDCNFEERASGSSSGCEQRHAVLFGTF